MKPILFAWIVCSTCFFACHTANKSILSDMDADKTTLQKMEYDWLAAEFKLDTATIAGMMDESFVAVGSSGLASRQQELDGIYRNISQRLKENHVVDSFYLDELRVQVYENSAVVSFVSVTRGSINKIPFSNRRTRFYDVWIKRKGRWKAVASQGTPL